MRAWLLPLLLLLAACGPAGSPGNHLRLDELPGQWGVINYWAIRGKPCAGEIPQFNALGQLPRAPGLGVQFDWAGGPDLGTQTHKKGNAFPTLDIDPAAQLGLVRPAVLPTTLVIDPSGTLGATLVGPQTLQSLTAATVDRRGGDH